jgi:hypothetical protein
MGGLAVNYESESVVHAAGWLYDRYAHNHAVLVATTTGP